MNNMGKRIWSSDQSESGIITNKSSRYCAGCMKHHSCYIVKWSDGKYTKPCTAAISTLPNGDLKIN